ncbi:dolichyl-phosphate-mannose-protein mannosyltransferase [Kineococcus rhizosphaerae]|uniref:Dolichyl-phosphate-mannose-protein mannosyltransferase n=1 Tax=Kineococcus rhizosphaerae TaxID=559628 RepID=A0A2T0QZS5_9ACTN|nr:dolichyl-phosphate-mannose-protein mannosyltransferase [Kineococcus rhizosphaerae]
MGTTAWRYDAKPLWRDEFYTLATAVRGWSVMLRGLRVTDAGLGPWYALMHPWVRVSQDEAWLRLPGAVATVVAVVVVAACARRLLDPVAGAAAGVVCTVLPVLVDHSQEARPYPLVVASVTVTAYALLRDRERPRTRWWVLWTGAATAAAALHVLSGAPAVAALIAVVLLQPARAPRRRVLLGAAFPALASFAMVAVGFSQAPDRIGDDFPVLSRTLGLWHSAAGGRAALVVVAVLCAVGLTAWSRRTDRGGRRFGPVFVTAWIAAPVLANAGSAWGGQLFEPRYSTAAAPGLAVLCGAGVAVLARGRGPRSSGAPRWRSVGAGLAVTLLVATQVPHLAQVRRQAYVVDDMPSLARDLAADVRPGDAVVYLGNTTRPMARYYLPPGLGLQDVLLRSDPAGSTSIGGDEVPEDERLASLGGFRRVWLVGVRLNDPWDVAFASSTTAAHLHRTMAFQEDRGQLRVELWAGPGAP